MQRLFDLLLALILFLPVLLLVLIIALAVRLFNKMPAFFFQTRLGRGNQTFTAIKINTMRPAKSEAEINDKQNDLLRLTRLGLWQRNRGLDELPQIWNILLGQMSFVGPRPLLKKNLAKIEADNQAIISEVKNWERLRSAVRPGLSGWHQIHSLGPHIIKYDLEYLKDPSLRRQLKVFLSSLTIMLIGKERYFAKARSSN